LNPEIPWNFRNLSKIWSRNSIIHSCPYWN